MLNVIMPSVVMLNVIILNGIMLSVIILNGIMLSGTALFQVPGQNLSRKSERSKNLKVTRLQEEAVCHFHANKTLIFKLCVSAVYICSSLGHLSEYFYFILGPKQ
jgi:hypothetical protein